MGLPSEEALILFGAIFVLATVLRVTFGSDTARTGRTDRRLAKARDYGLLSEVATVPSERAAAFVRDLLRGNGIRSTTAPVDDGVGQRVLVFPADQRAAADLLLGVNDNGFE